MGVCENAVYWSPLNEKVGLEDIFGSAVLMLWGVINTSQGPITSNTRAILPLAALIPLSVVQRRHLYGKSLPTAERTVVNYAKGRMQKLLGRL